MPEPSPDLFPLYRQSPTGGASGAQVAAWKLGNQLSRGLDRETLPAPTPSVFSQVPEWAWWAGGGILLLSLLTGAGGGRR